MRQDSHIFAILTDHVGFGGMVNQVAHSRITLYLDEESTILISDFLHFILGAGDADEAGVEMAGVGCQILTLIALRKC